MTTVVVREVQEDGFHCTSRRVHTTKQLGHIVDTAMQLYYARKLSLFANSICLGLSHEDRKTRADHQKLHISLRKRCLISQIANENIFHGFVGFTNDKFLVNKPSNGLKSYLQWLFCKIIVSECISRPQLIINLFRHTISWPSNWLLIGKHLIEKYFLRTHK